MIFLNKIKNKKLKKQIKYEKLDLETMDLH